MRALRSIAINVLFVLVACLSLPAGALAHAGLISSEPADASVLSAAPTELVLNFTEPVTPLVFTLVDAAGQRTDLDGAVSTDQQVRQPLPAALTRGTHLLTWRVVSADGHPVAGSLVFSVGAAGARPVAATSGDPAVGLAIWAVRAALYVALFFAVGTAVFGLTVAPLSAGSRRWSDGLAIAGIVLAPLALGLQGLDALGVGFGRLVSAAPWSTALATSYAATIAAIVVACIAALASNRLAAARLQATLVLVAWTAASLAPMLSGHAGTAPPDWLSKPAVLVHIASLLFWVGALLPLAALLLSPDPAALPALDRFSRLIPFAVAPLIGSGAVLAVLQMGPPGPTWQSPYAALFGAKLVTIALLLGLAVWNRLALTAPALAGVAPARTKLRRSIGLEVLLVLAILGIVAGWRFTPPPRVIAQVAAEPARLHLHTDAAMADIGVAPLHTGGAMRVWLADGALAPLTAKALSVSLANPSLGVERLKRNATLAPDGFWELPLLLPAAGLWTVDLDIRIDDFTLVKLNGQIELKP